MMAVIKQLFKIKLILIVLLIVSCNSNQEDLLIKKEKSKIVSIDISPQIIYPDSVLLGVLKEAEQFSAKRIDTDMDISMLIDKSNPKKIYVHYMPWFQSKSYDGYWGQHWTMGNKNPDKVNDGLQEIASFYNPLIGAYSSSDPYLQEYHFLLMKLCGVDGVIFDWYGSRDIYDYGLIKQATESFIPKLENIGLGFSIMYEDRVAYLGNDLNPIETVKADFKYIKDIYFTNSNYLKFNDKKYISVFGPHYITDSNDWKSIFSVFDDEEPPFLVSLWGTKAKLGKAFQGEFLWVSEDHIAAKDYYYNTYANHNNITIGSAYPGFSSYYNLGGWTEGMNTWKLPKNNGLTFVESLNSSTKAASDLIQIITWNDFGEGTMIEPTLQFGFDYLKMLQQYTGVKYDENDLKICVRLYKSRQKYRGNNRVMNLLDICYKYSKLKQMNKVDKLLQAIDRYFGNTNYE